MKPIIPRALRRAALCLPALGLMLAPLAAQSAARNDPARDGRRSGQVDDAVGGRAGIIDEINLGPVGIEAIKERHEDAQKDHVLSGRVVEMRGSTLYVDRQGVVVPLDLSALQIHKQPRVGQEIIASYSVDRTRNIASSLAGEVPNP